MQNAPLFLDLGRERLAYSIVVGRAPTIVWVGGFGSDMTGTKAQALSDWSRGCGRAFVRFDYFGHGASTGAFADGTITRWHADALAVIDSLTDGPLILVGSSMGGWIACLVALARPDRVAGLVLIAPAVDFTSALVEPKLSAEARRAIAETGVWLRPSDYGGYQPISAALLEDGARWTILSGQIPITVPVRILQGRADPDVPWTHALALSQAMSTSDQLFTLVGDGDHRLSRPQDLQRMVDFVSELAVYGEEAC